MEKASQQETGSAISQEPNQENHDETQQQKENKPSETTTNSNSASFSRNDAIRLLRRAQAHADVAESILTYARDVSYKYGLTVASPIVVDPFQPLEQMQPPQEDLTMEEQRRRYGRMRGTIPCFPCKEPTGTMELQRGGAGADGDATATATATVLSTTGGHSNTDHVVTFTGNYHQDRLAEFKRALKRRARLSRPEQRLQSRWDVPFKILGSRRRRIVRHDFDLPESPPEPPTSGYVLFVAQMTAKMRAKQREKLKNKKEQNKKRKNDKSRKRKRRQDDDDDEEEDDEYIPSEDEETQTRQSQSKAQADFEKELEEQQRHDQIKAVGEISRMWRFSMNDQDREYYIQFAQEAKEENVMQLAEFRATGSFRPSKKFTRLWGDLAGTNSTCGPWVRLEWEKKNALEKEMARMEPPPTVVPRPGSAFAREVERRKMQEEMQKSLGADG